VTRCIENVSEEISELLRFKHTEKHRTLPSGRTTGLALLGRDINCGSRRTTSQDLTPKTPKASSGVNFAVEETDDYAYTYCIAAPLSEILAINHTRDIVEISMAKAKAKSLMYLDFLGI
jgi:hypothetical protein